MLLVDLGYPPPEIEEMLAVNRTSRDPVDDIGAILSVESLNDLRGTVDSVRMEKSVSRYLLQIVTATRHHPRLRLGVSTRGTLLYSRMTRARALAQGRDFVIPEDVKALAIPVLSHRILLNNKAQYSGAACAQILEEILSTVPVPR